jgi:hypothetical protein
MLSSKTSICTVEGEKGAQNSGGPIQITSLKENFGGEGKIGLTVTLSHKGTGDMFFKDTDEKLCDEKHADLHR